MNKLTVLFISLLLLSCGLDGAARTRTDASTGTNYTEAGTYIKTDRPGTWSMSLRKMIKQDGTAYIFLIINYEGREWYSFTHLDLSVDGATMGFDCPRIPFVHSYNGIGYETAVFVIRLDDLRKIAVATEVKLTVVGAGGKAQHDFTKGDYKLFDDFLVSVN
jgi:hypothetical protein